MSVSPNMKIVNCKAYVSCKYLIHVFLVCALPTCGFWESVYICFFSYVCISEGSGLICLIIFHSVSCTHKGIYNQSNLQRKKSLSNTWQYEWMSQGEFRQEERTPGQWKASRGRHHLNLDLDFGHTDWGHGKRFSEERWANENDHSSYLFFCTC